MGDLGSTAAAVPIDPAAEKAALEWLDECCRLSPSPRVEYARALKALLAEPRLPAAPSEELLLAMRRSEIVPSADWRDHFLHAYRALYAELEKPKTKTVWEIHCVGAPAAALFERWPDATCELSRLVELGKRVTIERREVSL